MIYPVGVKIELTRIYFAEMNEAFARADRTAAIKLNNTLEVSYSVSCGYPSARANTERGLDCAASVDPDIECRS